ncbi:MAG: hypothetical protein E7666_00530 [Ruminococcaceae bacterium]|nr:hypothetical protein [Oscillospiraceae bacterium]
MKQKTNLITVVLFLTLLFGFSLAFFLMPDRAFSEQENRSLRTFPPFTLERLCNGSFGDDINDYFADQFPLRDSLVGWKGVTELGLGKGENDGILLGKNGQLAKRLYEIKTVDGEKIAVALDTFDPARIEAATNGINRLSQNLEVPLTVFLTGRTIDVAASAFSYPTEQSDALLSAIYREIDPSVEALNSVPMFRARYDSGEYVYYKTDHHWTTRGAYYAYTELMRTWGMEDEILPISAFSRETVSDSFYGTAWSAAGMKFVKPDTMEIWYRGNERDFSVVADGVALDCGLYNLNYLAKKDKYSTFLDGTHDVVTVTKKGEQTRPTLLILKDSFANAAAPFLAQHFDLVLLNLSSVRGDFSNVSALAGEYQADRVLLLYTVENLVTASKLDDLH